MLPLSEAAAPVPNWLYRLRRLFRAGTLPFDGFRLTGYGHGVPKDMIHRIARGDYENPEREAAKAVLRPGDRVLEIGGCMGVVSLTAARIVGAENVVVFEPNPAAASVARKNFERNGLPIRLENRAVGPEAGRTELAIGGSSWLGASIGGAFEDGQKISVDVAAIADLVGDLRPTVLVMDAEGFETAILPACPLAGLRALIVEFHEAPGAPERMEDLRHLLRNASFVRDETLSVAGDGVSTEVWMSGQGRSGR